MKTLRTLLFLLFSVLLSVSITELYAQDPLTNNEVDELVESVLTTFDVPGIAVAIVKDGEVILEKGYGVSSLHTKQNVDENTLFGIASNSKAFTCAALGMLVEKGELHWDDKVVDYIPEFRLYNAYVTEDFTIRDLLTHRSGLPLGAGDLMVFPDQNNYTTNDIIHNLRYLKQSSPFRSKFDYDNLLYIVAGEVLCRVSGLSWAEYVEEQIMAPLHMTQSIGSYSRITDHTNIIDAHAPVDGKVVVVDRYDNDVLNPAGGIYSSAHDLTLWCNMWLNNGLISDGEPEEALLTPEMIHEIWTAQTSLPVRSNNPFGSHFSAYGLGWFLTDVNGYLEASHTGGLNGMVSQITLIPELNLGIIVLTNQQNGAAFSAITNTIKQAYIGMESTNWVEKYKERETRYMAYTKGVVDEVWNKINDEIDSASEKPESTIYTGSYSDKWFGEMEVMLKNGKMWLDSKQSKKLKGEMFYYKGNTFVVKWIDRSMDADAFVIFNLDKEGNANGCRMEAISPMTDFSYDFHDLEFIKMKK